MKTKLISTSTSRYLIVRFISLLLMGVTQLLLPIAFIRNYGTERFGFWILVFSISSISSTLDLGWVSSLSVKAIQDKYRDAQIEFQSNLSKIHIISVRQGKLVASTGILAVLSFEIYRDKVFDNTSFSICVAAIFISVFSIRMKGIEAIFRASGSTLGFTLMTGNFLTNSLLTLLLVYSKLNLGVIAVIVATSSFVFFLVASKKCRLHLKSLNAEIFKQRKNTSPNLDWGDAIGFFTFPLSYLLLNECMNILVAVTLGTSSLGIFALIRTYVGIFRQVTTLFTDSYSPTLSEMIASRKLSLAKVIFKRMQIWIYSINMLISIAFLVTLEFTHIVQSHSSHFPKSLFLVFVASAICDIPWNTYFVILASSNNLKLLAWRFAMSCALTLFAAFWLLQELALAGAAIALLLPDIFMTIRTRTFAVRIMNGEQ